MKETLRRLWRQQQGQTLVEYALIVALVAVGAITALTFFRDRLDERYTNVVDSMPQ